MGDVCPACTQGDMVWNEMEVYRGEGVENLPLPSPKILSDVCVLMSHI
jgi:hypothetical protein